MEEKILYLPLKKKWYEMIESGEKPEEYREARTTTPTPWWNGATANSGAWTSNACWGMGLKFGNALMTHTCKPITQ